MSRRVQSERAEEAIADIRLVVLEFQRAQAVPADNPPGRVPGHGPTVGQRAAQLALANVVSCAELFSAEVLRSLPGVVENDVSSWAKQQLAWQTHAGLDLETLPSYPAVRGFNEMRNAALHGRGRLTPRQVKGKLAEQVEEWLAAAGAKVLRGAVHVTEQDIVRCADACCVFVRQVDLR